MQNLEHYEQGWLARGRFPTPEQRQGLAAAHRKARRALYAVFIGTLILVAAVFTVGGRALWPLPTLLGLLAGASLILAGGLARSTYLASLMGTLRSRQLGRSWAASWLAAIANSVALVAALAAATSGDGLQAVPLVIATMLGAIAPWFIK